MSLEDIVVTLKALGIQFTVMESASDGALLVLPEYGRILGVWPHWRSDNALWVNPDFMKQLQIGAKDDAWLNPGGDRMWLGPEEEFVPDGAVAAVIDPGRYSQLSEKGPFTMENRGEARAWKSDMRMRFRIVRRIRPLGEEDIPEAWGTRWLRQAGYAEETTLEVSGEIPPEAWLWSLIQVPAGAEVRAAAPADEDGKILCIEERDEGRGHLIVREFEAAGTGGRPPAGNPPGARPLPGWRFSPGQDSGELSCISPSAGPRDRRRITWKTKLFAFSGRIEELRTASSRIAR